MLAFTTSIQYTTGCSSKCNQTRKGNKRHPVWRGKREIILFTSDMILHVENCKYSTEKQLELTNEFSKVAGYKFDTQKNQFISIH